MAAGHILVTSTVDDRMKSVALIRVMVFHATCASVKHLHIPASYTISLNSLRKEGEMQARLCWSVVQIEPYGTPISPEPLVSPHAMAGPVKSGSHAFGHDLVFMQTTLMIVIRRQDSSNDTASPGQVTAMLSLMVQADLDTTIWAQDDTREILCERCRVSRLDPTVMLHQPYGEIVYFCYSKLLCVPLVF
jgi:hypothetical protein